MRILVVSLIVHYMSVQKFAPYRLNNQEKYLQAKIKYILHKIIASSVQKNQTMCLCTVALNYPKNEIIGFG